MQIFLCYQTNLTTSLSPRHPSQSSFPTLFLDHDYYLQRHFQGVAIVSGTPKEAQCLCKDTLLSGPLHAHPQQAWHRAGLHGAWQGRLCWLQLVMESRGSMLCLSAFGFRLSIIISIAFQSGQSVWCSFSFSSIFTSSFWSKTSS